MTEYEQQQPGQVKDPFCEHTLRTVYTIHGVPKNDTFSSCPRQEGVFFFGTLRTYVKNPEGRVQK